MNQFEVKLHKLSSGFIQSVYRDPKTGKRKRKRFPTLKEAKDYKKRVENYHSLNIEELVCLFVQDYPNSPFTKKKAHLIDFVETFGDFLLNDLTTPMLKSWLNQIKQENNLQDISVRGIKCEVDTFFAYLVKREIISESPMARIYYQKYVPNLKARNLLTTDEIEKLLVSLYDYSPGYLYPMTKLFAETGAKTSEVVELEWSEVNLENGTVTFKGNKKSQKRVIKISDELVSIFSKRIKKSSKVFMTYYGEPFTTKKLSLAINEFKRKKLYTGPWCPMDLRHSFAVNYLSSGGDIRKLQEILGHDNVFDTKRLYGEAVKNKVTETVASPFE